MGEKKTPPVCVVEWGRKKRVLSVAYLPRRSAPARHEFRCKFTRVSSHRLPLAGWGCTAGVPIEKAVSPRCSEAPADSYDSFSVSLRVAVNAGDRDASLTERNDPPVVLCATMKATSDSSSCLSPKTFSTFTRPMENNASHDHRTIFHPQMVLKIYYFCFVFGFFFFRFWGKEYFL